MHITLQGKVAIVTGACSGIGHSITRQFLESEASGVVAVDHNPQLPEALADCRSRFGERLQFIQGDVGNETTAVAYTQAALDQFGRIDVLVSNAAISVIKPIHLHSPQEWDAVFNTNVKAVYWASRHLIPVMIRQKQGLILMTGSISGEVGLPTQGAYAPSKGALHQMTRQMAVEYAPHGIRINAIAPGTVDTAIVHASAQSSGNPEAYWDMLRSNHPIARIASPDEVATFFTYMASDHASFFTGAVLMMDGGFTAR